MNASGPTPPARRIDVLPSRSRIGIVVVVIVLLVLGVAVLYAVITQDGLGVAGRIIGAFFGLLFAGMGLLFLIDLPAVLGRHTLVFDHDSVAYEVTLGRYAFRAGWGELERIRISTADRSGRSNSSTLVRLSLVPVDVDAFAARHPSLDKAREGNGYTIPLGPNPGVVEPVADALRTYAGPRDGGVGDDGRATGGTYR